VIRQSVNRPRSTTFPTLSDTSYIPVRQLAGLSYLHADELRLVVYAHSIDLWGEGLRNLLELAVIAAPRGLPISAVRLVRSPMIVKSPTSMTSTPTT